MALLPIGHDRDVDERPTVTPILIGVLALVFAWSTYSDVRAYADYDAALGIIEGLADRYPNARSHTPLVDLPPELELQLEPYVNTQRTVYERGDMEMDVAIGNALTALHRVPLFSFGYTSRRPSVIRAFTSLFIHADFTRLFGSLLVLWVAGSALEAALGRWRFLGVYFGCGLAAVLVHQILFWHSAMPAAVAPGAIAGVVGVFLTGMPSARVRVAFARPPFTWDTFYAPGWSLVLYWIVVEALLVLGRGGVSMGAARDAQLVGLVTGLGAGWLMRRRDWFEELRSIEDVPPPAVTPGGRPGVTHSQRPVPTHSQRPVPTNSQRPEAMHSQRAVPTHSQRPDADSPQSLPPAPVRPAAHEVEAIELKPADPKASLFDEFD